LLKLCNKNYSVIVYCSTTIVIENDCEYLKETVQSVRWI